jgi:hypothetical protein
VEALGAELGELARMDPNGVWTYGPVNAWLAEGATPELLRQVFARVAARDGYAPPKLLDYFRGAVTDAIAAARAAAAPPPSARSSVYDFPAYRRAFDDWRTNGMPGPAPVLTDFPREAAHAA